MESSKCQKCNKETTLLCHKCKKPICSNHCHTIRRRFFCANCFLAERNAGIVKSWLMLGLIIVIGYILIKLVS